jgi:hypothetical protein
VSRERVGCIAMWPCAAASTDAKCCMLPLLGKNYYCTNIYCPLVLPFVLPAGESEETAAERAREVVAACEDVHRSVSRLFEGIDMPASSVWLWPRS